jgi:hypothetical protein
VIFSLPFLLHSTKDDAGWPVARKLMLRLAKVVFALILVAAATQAVGETHLVGLAGQSCQTWTANPPTSGGGLGLLNQQWILGFLSGVSFADADHDPLTGVDAAAITTWVDNYCQENGGSARLADAAVAFVRAHRP